MRDLLEVKGLFDAISSTTLSTIKSRIIKENKDNELFKYCINFLVGSNVVTGISRKKINKQLNLNLTNREFKDIIDLCEYVLKNNTGTDQVIINVQNYIQQQPEELREFISGLITKSIKLGANAKLINKAIPGLIFEFGIMAASKYDDEVVKNKEFIISKKVNGFKCIAIVENGTVKLCSRTGKLYEGMTDIECAIKDIPQDNFVLDGEIYAIGNFKNSHEGYKETSKRATKKGIKHGLKLIVYDYISTLEEFDNGVSNDNTIIRKTKVKELIGTIDSPYLEYLEPFYMGNDISKIDEIGVSETEKGEEGIIISLADFKWEKKRSKGCLKYKLFKEGDILVKSIYLGEGKYDGLMGGVNCEFLYNGEIAKVGVGSGWKDEERKYLIEHPEEIVGKIITVSYLDVTHDLEGNYSLNLPTISPQLPYPLCIRLDKFTLEDTNIE